MVPVPTFPCENEIDFSLFLLFDDRVNKHGLSHSCVPVYLNIIVSNRWFVLHTGTGGTTHKKKEKYVPCFVERKN
jgi:hypothetical protein